MNIALDAVRHDSLPEKNLEGQSDKINDPTTWEKYSSHAGATVLDLSVLLCHALFCCTVYLV